MENTWLNGFIEALANKKYNNFSMVYQPIYNFDGKAKLAGYEALMRYKCASTNKMIAPDDFIKAAENHSFMCELGQYAMKTSIDEFCRTQDNNLFLSVNVSYQQFLHPWFSETVIATLYSMDMKPWQLTLEITESSHITDFAQINRTIELLSAHGVRFSIDDFGSGYANISLLSKLYFDTLKVDRSCTDDVVSNDNTRKVLHNLKRLADDLGVGVIVEGVENKPQLTVLSELGFSKFQGWYFGKPGLL